MHAKSLQLCPTVWPYRLAHQAPLSMEFSRQEYQSGLPYLCPGDLPDPRIKRVSLTPSASTGGFFTTSTTWETPLCMDTKPSDICFANTYYFSPNLAVKKLRHKDIRKPAWAHGARRGRASAQIPTGGLELTHQHCPQRSSLGSIGLRALSSEVLSLFQMRRLYAAVQDRPSCDCFPYAQAFLQLALASDWRWMAKWNVFSRWG